MEKLTKEEINFIITLVTRFIMKETATAKEFVIAERIVKKLSEN